MLHFSRQPITPPTLFCTLCGQEIPLGEEYWACNGSRICIDCLPAFARQELAPCRETHGKELAYDFA